MDRYQITPTDFHQLLSYLLSQQIVEEVLSGSEKGNRYTIIPEFVKDPKLLEKFPLTQLLTYNFARTDSVGTFLLQSHETKTHKVAVVGHACDIRALIEMSKKQQAKWENLFLISFEDYGYINIPPMMKFLKAANMNAADLIGERLTSTQLFLKLKDGSVKKFQLGKEINITENCSRCIQKVHPLADITISTYGIPEDSDDFILTPQSDRAKSLISSLKWQGKVVSESIMKAYTAEAANILENCTKKRNLELDAFDSSSDRLQRFSKCTGCGLCVKSCPVCFCVTCNLLPQVKAKTMDKVNFLLTRFSHVGDTCIECGKCDANCPVNVPLGLYFQSLRRQLKTHRNYEAGISLTSKPLHLDA